MLSGRATGIAKSADGNVEAIRALLIAKRSGRETRIACLNQIRHLGFCAPDDLRERLRDLPLSRLAGVAASLRPQPGTEPVTHATKLALRTLGRRVQAINDDAQLLDSHLGELVERTAPSLLALHGIGVDTAAILLVAAGDNPERLRTEAPGPASAASLRSPRRPGRSPGIGSTAAGTATPTTPSGASPSPA